MGEQENWELQPGTDAQRKKLFAMLNQHGIDKELFELTAQLDISVMTKGQMSHAISLLEKTSDPIADLGKWSVSREDTAQKKPTPPETKTPAQKPEIVQQTVETQATTEPQRFDVVQIGDMEISEASISNLRKIPTMLNSIFKNIMQKGTDYDVIPGTQKPTLLKPGAELLRLAFGLNYTTEIDAQFEDWDHGRFYYRIKTHFVNRQGVVVGTGIGSANSEETRYSSRWVFESDIPEGTDKASLKSKTRTSKNNKEYKVYLVDPDIHEKATQVNTLQKMAKKRSFVDGILSITGASRIFTQDVEDIVGAQ